MISIKGLFAVIIEFQATILENIYKKGFFKSIFMKKDHMMLAKAIKSRERMRDEAVDTGLPLHRSLLHTHLESDKSIKRFQKRKISLSYCIRTDLPINISKKTLISALCVKMVDI
jgi:hypothetical protein